MSLLTGPDTTFIKKRSVFANRARHYMFLGREVSLLMGPDTIFIRKGIILANRAGHYIH